MTLSNIVRRAAAVALGLATPLGAQAQESDAALASKLSNPVASLTSVPFQLNHDCCFGPDEGARQTLNIQPVIPFAVSDDWNLIVRTIIPVIHQERTSANNGEATGLGDVTQSFFFSPSSSGGLTWAVGPVLLYPTGSSDFSARKWGAGPSALVLKQNKGWTYGVLANHIWSVAGDEDRNDVDLTFVQPFMSWTSPRATTVGINTEATYNWRTRSWTAPVNLTVSQLYKFGSQRVSLGGGVKIYAARDGSGPAWGARVTTTLLFPR
ncbi:hypothetical protein ACFODL_17920 [Phenylobacterium terrae]|uniref:Transporter n=1 Tax=Phenylobacterium terrae TaxID=2665495 RepID=A0ABW4N2A6_9CAUL